MTHQELADFPVVTFDKIRYADTDRQGHVNNAVFATFLETGRVELLYDRRRPLTSDGGEFVIVSLGLSFTGEIHWPGEVQIGTCIRKIGKSSIDIGQVLFQDDRRVAEAETVVVQIDMATRQAKPLSPETRDRLQGLTLRRRE